MPNHTEEASQLSALLKAAVDRSSHSILILHRHELLLASHVARQTFNLDEAALYKPLRVDGPGGLLIERIEEALATSPGDATVAFNYRLAGGPADVERILTVSVIPLDADHTLIEATPRQQPLDAEVAQTASHLRHHFKTPLAIIKLGLSHFSHNYDKLSEQERLGIIEDITQEITRLTGDLDSLAVGKQ